MNRIGQLWRKLTGSSKPKPELRDQSENGLSGNSHDIEYVTRIYGGGIETGVKP